MKTSARAHRATASAKKAKATSKPTPEIRVRPRDRRGTSPLAPGLRANSFAIAAGRDPELMALLEADEERRLRQRMQQGRGVHLSAAPGGNVVRLAVECPNGDVPIVVELDRRYFESAGSVEAIRVDLVAWLAGKGALLTWAPTQSSMTA